MDSKKREKMEKELEALKKSLKEYEDKLEKAENANDRKAMVNYAMAVAGIKNSIREIGTQLR